MEALLPGGTTVWAVSALSPTESRKVLALRKRQFHHNEWRHPSTMFDNSLGTYRAQSPTGIRGKLQSSAGHSLPLGLLPRLLRDFLPRPPPAKPVCGGFFGREPTGIPFVVGRGKGKTCRYKEIWNRLTPLRSVISRIFSRCKGEVGKCIGGGATHGCGG